TTKNYGNGVCNSVNWCQCGNVWASCNLATGCAAWLCKLA
uniref:Bacteriocin E50-52 n=1 Tax=Enterococcus faecium TaxID=1352 RepID=ETC50_ENTFC|nr:RecName: Full=Bacteriocin E50-52 [Enterococcus faecium]